MTQQSRVLRKVTSVLALVALLVGVFFAGSKTTLALTVNTVLVNSVSSGYAVKSSNKTTTTVSGTTDAIDGTNVTITITDSLSAQVVNTTTVSSGAYSFSNIDTSSLADGNLTVQVDIDDDGTGAGTLSVTVKKDTVSPTVTLNAPTGTSNTSVTASVKTDEDATCTYTLDGGSSTAMSITGTSPDATDLFNLTVGSHSATFTCTDAAGNTGSTSANWTVAEQISGGGGGGFPVNISGPILSPAPTPAPQPNAPTGEVLGAVAFGDGALVKTSDSNTVYLVSNLRFRPIISSAVFLARGLNFSDIQIVSANLTRGTNVGRLVGYPEGTVLKGSGPTLYKVSGDTIVGIPSMTVFKRLKLSLNKVVKLSDTELSNYDDGGVAK